MVRAKALQFADSDTASFENNLGDSTYDMDVQGRMTFIRSGWWGIRLGAL